MAEESGNMIFRLRGLAFVASAELVQGRWNAVHDVVHRALEEGRRRGLPFQDAELLTHLALAELGRSRPEAALRAADNAVAVAGAQRARVSSASLVSPGRALFGKGGCSAEGVARRRTSRPPRPWSTPRAPPLVRRSSARNSGGSGARRPSSGMPSGSSRPSAPQDTPATSRPN